METHPVVFGSGETECSDLHIRMIHLRQANKRDHDLAAFRELQNENLFTDMTLVLKVINNLKQKKNRVYFQLFVDKIITVLYVLFPG
jgi:hypothetical protein